MDMAIGNYWTTKEVADFLGVTAGRVRQFVVEKRLNPEKKIGQVLFFDREKVADFADLPRKSGPQKSVE